MVRSRRAIHAASAALFGFVAITGLYVLLAELFTPGYFPMLAAHVYVGLLLAIAVPIGLGLHLKRTSSPGLRSMLPVVALLAIPTLLVEIALRAEIRSVQDVPSRDGLDRLFGEIALLVWGTDGGDGATVGSAAGLATGLALFSAALAWWLRERQPSVPVRWTGVLATAALMLAVTTGLTSWLGRGDARFDAFAAHSLVGLLCIVATVAHLRAPRRWLGPRLGAVALVAVLAGATWAWVETYPEEHTWRVQDDVPEMGPRDLHADGADLGQPIDASLLEGSAGCGEAGCHEALTHQWQGSAHAFAADNALYRAVVRQLVSERGAGEARFCAGCHDPVRALAGTVEAAYAAGDPPPGEGVSCVVCHVMVAHTGEPKNGDAAYRTPIPYPGTDEDQRAARIRLDPRYHRMTMTSPLTVHRELCGTCHRVRLGPFMGAAVEVEVQNAYEGEGSMGGYGGTSQLCSDCHLPTTTEQPRHSLLLYDHQMGGLNLDLPAYVTHPEADRAALADGVARVEAMIAGALPDGRQFPPPPFVADWPLAEGAPGVLAVEVTPTRVADQLAVRVTTGNPRIGHAFPVGPFDLREVWLRVVVRDDAGDAIATLGALDADGRVPEDAPRLGAVELDRSGQPLRRHRIWDVAGVRDKRTIPRGGTVTDDVVLALPPDAAGPLTVEATWLVRRTNPDFAAFALGPEHPGFPVHEVAWGRSP